MDRNQKIILALASVMAVLAAGILIGRFTGPAGADRGAGTTTGSPSKDGKTEDGTVDDDIESVDTPPSGVVLFDAKARSVHASQATVEATKVRLSGRLGYSFSVESSTDGNGKERGPGTIRVTGSTSTIGADALSVQTVDAFVTPKTIRMGGGSRIEWEGDLRVTGGTITYTSHKPDATPKRLAGPVTTTASRGMVVLTPTETVRWLNPPSRITLSEASRTNFSWAGSGTLRTDKRTVKTTYGGLMGTALSATVHRSGKSLRVRGDATYSQVFAGGKPLIRTTGRVDVKRRPQAVARGARGWFSWAPTNPTAIDMCITRIRAMNAAGRWVNMNLSTLDPMFGGQKHRGIGGDTTTLDGTDGGSFFSGASPITSVIQAKTGDERDISFDVPVGAKKGQRTITLRLEGNFPAITVKIPVRVT